nr:hypothetical protein CFP56_63397 [Quercus suber]POE94759.1 hypothetical protein CFP56_16996 [Quercus suber]
MNRLGLVHPSTLAGKHMAETRNLYEGFSALALNDRTFTSKLPFTGALIGIPGILLHTPRIGRAFIELTKAIDEISSLNPRMREIITVSVATHEQAYYDIYAHKQMALQVGLTESELDVLISGEVPSNVQEGERAASQAAKELCNYVGPLTRQTWEDMIIAMGQEAARAVVHLVALYRYRATMLRGFDAQVPSASERVE